MEYKQSFYNGLLMTAGILASTFAVKQVKKDLAPGLTAKSAVSLATVTVLSQLGIDYAKDKRWLSSTI